MKIFLSHINEEAQIAQTLKAWIESTFQGNAEVFVSSDKGSLPPGKKWLNVISENLAEADMLLVLCSSESIVRPWVNFETGAGWVKDIETIPICHSGLTMVNLPRPLNDFQGLVIEDKSFAVDLINTIGQKIGIETIPRLNYEQLSDELLKAVKSVPKEETQTESNDVNSDSNADLDENGMKILQILANNAGQNSIREDQLAGATQLKPPMVRYHLNKLEKLKLIGFAYTMDGPTRCYITDQGLEIAVEKGLIS